MKFFHDTPQRLMSLAALLCVISCGDSGPSSPPTPVEFDATQPLAPLG